MRRLFLAREWTALGKYLIRKIKGGPHRAIRSLNLCSRYSYYHCCSRTVTTSRRSSRPPPSLLAPVQDQPDIEILDEPVKLASDPDHSWRIRVRDGVTLERRGFEDRAYEVKKAGQSVGILSAVSIEKPEQNPRLDVEANKATYSEAPDSLAKDSMIVLSYAPYQEEELDGMEVFLDRPSYPIRVPSSYVYDPSRGALHDYCTKSPDRWLSADFRGPCARHDMCYERNTSPHRRDKCQGPFHRRLRHNCKYYYKWHHATFRSDCLAVAAGYYAAVKLSNDLKK